MQARKRWVTRRKRTKKKSKVDEIVELMLEGYEPDENECYGCRLEFNELSARQLREIEKRLAKAIGRKQLPHDIEVNYHPTYGNALKVATKYGGKMDGWIEWDKHDKTFYIDIHGIWFPYDKAIRALVELDNYPDDIRIYGDRVYFWWD